MKLGLPTIAIGALALVAATAIAQNPVELTSGAQPGQKIPIAVPTFAAADPGVNGVVDEMTQVMAYDLDFSGLFTVLRKENFPAGLANLDPDVAKLNLDAWAATRVQKLVWASVRQEGSELVAQFRLFDMATKNQVVGQELRVARNFPRLASHRFSEEIIRFLNGTPGIGTSEICFSGTSNGHKEIYVADYDGANVKQVTQHNSISIKPKMSPDGQNIAYVSFKDRYTYLYVYNRQSGMSVPLSKEVGLNAAPAWAPDGKQIAMSLSKDGNTEIYIKNADGSNPRRLTKNKDGDTSPTFSPDGSKIAFVSDRGGKPQVYVMDRDGGNASRLSHQGGSAYDPVWSPDGKSIAYVVEAGGFQIYVMNADGSNARALTSGGNNESPSWSPDSRHIIYTSTSGGRPQLQTVTLDTGEHHTVSGLRMNTEGPYWGPSRR